VLSVVAAALAAGSAIGGGVALAVLAGLLVQPALLLHERVFVMAAQDPPLS
jgi:hypothetical protein